MNENNQYPFIDITEVVGVGKDFEPPFCRYMNME